MITDSKLIHFFQYQTQTIQVDTMMPIDVACFQISFADIDNYCWINQDQNKMYKGYP